LSFSNSVDPIRMIMIIYPKHFGIRGIDRLVAGVPEKALHGAASWAS
jgi:hypothetical protein